MAGRQSRAEILKSGGGDGTVAGMEARVSRLETIAEDTKGVLDKILAQLTATDGRIATMDNRITGMDGRIASMDNRMAGMDSRLASMDNRIATVEERMTAVDTRVAAFDTRFSAIDTRIQVIDAKLDSKPDQGWIFNLLTAMIASSLGIAGLTLATVSVLK